VLARISTGRDRRIPVFPVGLGQRVDRTLLWRIGKATHGGAYLPSKVGVLPKAFRAVLKHLRTRYELRFESPGPESSEAQRVLRFAVNLAGAEAVTHAKYRAMEPPPPPKPAGPTMLAANGGAVSSGGSTGVFQPVDSLGRITFRNYRDIARWVYVCEPGEFPDAHISEKKCNDKHTAGTGRKITMTAPAGTYDLGYRTQEDWRWVELGTVQLVPGQHIRINPPTLSTD
jgi:hypothetical protein